jgi:ketosteroid isomerase-like protein
MEKGLAINHEVLLHNISITIRLIKKARLVHIKPIERHRWSEPEKPKEKPMSLKSVIATAAAVTAFVATPPLMTANANGNQPTYQQLADELALMRIPTEVETAVDRKDWAKARSFFAENVRVDFTSLVGGEPATIKSDDLIAGWSGNLKGNKESLHIRGGALVTINGDTASVYSNGYAWNKMPGGPDGDLWEVWGNYTHEFSRTSDGWKITSFTFNKVHERGSNFVKTTPGS